MLRSRTAARWSGSTSRGSCCERRARSGVTREAASRSVESSAAPSSARRPSAGQAWYTLGLLIVCYLFNQVDRNILSMVADDIKRDLGLSDARIGFLYGTAFSVFYVE